MSAYPVTSGIVMSSLAKCGVKGHLCSRSSFGWIQAKQRLLGPNYPKRDSALSKYPWIASVTSNEARLCLGIVSAR